MPETAMGQILKIDHDREAQRKSIDLIMHLLHPYIPDACFRDARERLYEAFDKDGIELTNKMMRKEYEAWKSLQIEGLPKL